jgi:hypothetical protein
LLTVGDISRRVSYISEDGVGYIKTRDRTVLFLFEPVQGGREKGEKKG